MYLKMIFGSGKQMTNDALFRELKKKCPFIYFIKNKHFFMGYRTFKECNADEIEMFNVFVSEYDKLKAKYDVDEIKYNIAINCLKELAVAMRNIINKGESYCENGTIDELYDLVKDLSPEENIDLKNQISRYIESYSFMDIYEIFSNR